MSAKEVKIPNFQKKENFRAAKIVEEKREKYRYRWAKPLYNKLRGSRFSRVGETGHDENVLYEELRLGFRVHIPAGSPGLAFFGAVPKSR